MLPVAQADPYRLRLMIQIYGHHLKDSSLLHLFRPSLLRRTIWLDFLLTRWIELKILIYFSGLQEALSTGMKKYDYEGTEEQRNR